MELNILCLQVRWLSDGHHKCMYFTLINPIIMISWFIDTKVVGVDAAETIQNISEVDNTSITIIIPPEVFNISVLHDEEDISMVFAEYDSSALYPLPPDSVLFTDENVTYTNFSVASTLLTATIVGHEDDIVDLDVDVTVVLKLDSKVTA